MNASKSNLWLFLIPSLLGVFLFMIPIPYNDSWTIPVAILAGFIQKENVLGPYIPGIMTFLITLTALGSIFTKLVKPDFITKYPFWNNLFNVSYFWLIVRVLGAVFAVMTFYQLGPEIVWSADTGGLLLGDGGLLSVLFAVFLFAGLLLPLLLNFGLLEFFGALLTKVMRPLFKLPGRASIDSLASWIGDGTIGVLLTSKQYEDGYYTKKEAAIIGTTFSIVSITFSLVVISEVGLEHMFIPFYITVTVAGFIAALIMPRIPPLSRKPETYSKEVEGQKELVPEGMSYTKWGFSMALKKASTSSDPKQFFKDGGKNILDMWMGVAPIVMAVGTIALMLSMTPFFEWIGMPFIPLLELLQVPEAKEAAPLMVVGFADMFLPAILGSGIESEMTRFIVASLSVTQLIYMSEVGGLLLASKVPVSFLDLVIIFIQRTLITLPIIVLIAHFIF